MDPNEIANAPKRPGAVPDRLAMTAWSADRSSGAAADNSRAACFSGPAMDRAPWRENESIFRPPEVVANPLISPDSNEGIQENQGADPGRAPPLWWNPRKSKAKN
jgi:hypothetical protein